MDGVLIVSVSIILIYDFLKLKYSSKKSKYIYVIIVAIIASVALFNTFLKTSPLEAAIELLQPIIDRIIGSS